MRNPRAPCARRERTTSRAALLRAADTRRTALGLAAVDAVPVLAGHGPQAVALDMTRLLARACAGTRLTRVRSIAPRETLVDLHAIDQTRSREQRRVDGVGRRRPTVLAVAEEQISITLLVAPTDVAVHVVPGLELLELVQSQLRVALAARSI